MLNQIVHENRRPRYSLAQKYHLKDISLWSEFKVYVLQPEKYFVFVEECYIKKEKQHEICAMLVVERFKKEKRAQILLYKKKNVILVDLVNLHSMLFVVIEELFTNHNIKTLTSVAPCIFISNFNSQCFEKSCHSDVCHLAILYCLENVYFKREENSSRNRLHDLWERKDSFKNLAIPLNFRLVDLQEYTLLKKILPEVLNNICLEYLILKEGTCYFQAAVAVKGKLLLDSTIVVKKFLGWTLRGALYVVTRYIQPQFIPFIKVHLYEMENAVVHCHSFMLIEYKLHFS
jgi:hypothetical protein